METFCRGDVLCGDVLYVCAPFFWDCPFNLKKLFTVLNVPSVNYFLKLKFFSDSDTVIFKARNSF
jgi:hypothetical protein